MPINVYTGLQGSGKTYEVVSSVLIPALSTGRRVVTNIRGLDFELIKDYILKRFENAVIGELVIVTDDDVNKAHFFPESQDDGESLVKGGDLVCLDEAWRFFGVGIKPNPKTKVFLREHRHFASSSGVTCDLVLMLQAISDLERFTKSVVELSFKTTKLKVVGLNGRYRLDMFEGSDQKLSRRVNTWQKEYKKEIFPLYSSYDKKGAREVAIDSRQNILRDPRIWGYAVLVLIIVIAAVWSLRYLYKRYSGVSDNPAVSAAESAKPSPSPSASPSPAPSARQPEPSSFRIVGTVQTWQGRFYAVLGESGRVRLEPYGPITGDGSFASGVLDGQRVTTWGGAAPASNVSQVLK